MEENRKEENQIEENGNESTTKNWLVLALFLVLVALAIYFFFVRPQGDNDNNGPSSEDVAIERQFDGKIVYSSSNLDELDEEALRDDCAARNGQFQECGDICAPGAEICADVCAYTCILPTENGDNTNGNGNDNGDTNGEVSYDWQTYSNSSLGFATEVVEEMQIGQEAEGRIEFMLEGPEQEDGTELYDGVRILVSRLSFDQNTTLKGFAEELAQTGPAVNNGLIQGVTLENDYDYATYTFTKDSMGENKHLIALIYPGEAFDISVFVSDNKYQAIADRFLSSFEITDSQRASNQIEGEVEVDSPKLGESIDSPVTIEGRAVGTWLFEASFSAVLTDWDGLIIGEAVLQTSDDWMTEEMVSFRGTLTFNDETQRTYPRGILILQKANPSGLPENDEALEFPVYLE